MADDDYRLIQQPGPGPEPDSGLDQITIDLGDAPSDDDLVDGALKIEVGDDGAVEIDFNPPSAKAAAATGKFDDNLALLIPEGELSNIASSLLTAIEEDERSRQGWIDTRARGIDLLGFKIEDPKSDGGEATAPVEGMSTVRHPLLSEAIIRFQSNASAELLPAWGPVKVRNDATPKPPGADMAQGFAPGLGHNGGPPLQDSDDLAEALEKDFNHYLTAVDRGYRADFDRMLFEVGFGGSGFRKIYNDPIRRMPLSRSVDPSDLIVNNAEFDLDDCRRITHRILMRKSEVIRMQLAGVYRDVPLGQPTYHMDVVAEKKAETQGFTVRSLRPEDTAYTIYECYCELDIAGFQHMKDGKPTGLELPYKVTIERDSRQVLEIRRNWRQDDSNCLAKKIFVKYPFVPTFGFYETGLLQILGNASKALTAAWREALDNGMFANFPGFLYADFVGKQLTNEFRVPPGGGKRVQTGGKGIRDAVMPLPYKETGPGFMKFMEMVETTAQRIGGTADIQVGEGKQDAPVGTTLALIEQATKVLSAVHVRLHAAQSEEFQLLKERFREDPEAFWRKNKRPAVAWQVEQFLQALDDYDLVPAADPNNPSHMHRIMKAIAIKQLQAMNPQLYNAAAVDRYILNMIGLTNIDHLFNKDPAPPNAGAQAPPPDPVKLAEIQAKQQQTAAELAQRQQEQQAKQVSQASQQDSREKELAVESADRAADRASRERVAQMREDTEQIKTAGEVAKHRLPSGDALVDAQTDMAQHHTQSADALAAAQAQQAPQQPQGFQTTWPRPI